MFVACIILADRLACRSSVPMIGILGPTTLNQGLLEIFDYKGSLVYQIMLYDTDIDLTFLSSGFYTLRLSVSGISRSIKWVKR